jgi:transcriptional regulator with XRE-family HTH domain
MNFAEKLRALMDERGINGCQLARQAYCDRSLVYKYRQGKREPSPEMAGRFDKVLDAGGELAALALRPPNAPAAPSPGREGGRLLALEPVIRHPLADAEYVTHLREAIQQFAALETRYGGSDVLPIAARTFRAAHSRLASGSYVPGAERDLQAAVGEAGEVAAWVAYDSDQQPLSRALCQEAMLVSRLAGDRSMELFDLTHLAMQSIHLHRSAEALRIADDMLNGPQLAARVTALLHLRRGRALAQLGDRPRALAAISQARSLLSDGITEHDPVWTWWIDEPELAWHEGMAHAELGDWPAAVALFQASSAGRDPHARARDRYNDTAHLLNALAHVGAWQEAEPIAAGLVETAAEIGSTRIANLLRRITRRIKAKDTTSALADSAEELADTLA